MASYLDELSQYYASFSSSLKFKLTVTLSYFKNQSNKIQSKITCTNRKLSSQNLLHLFWDLLQ